MKLAAALAAAAATTASAAFCDPAALITKHEGSRLCAYTDTTGHITVGVGFNMDAVSAGTWGSICADCPSYEDVHSKAKCITEHNVNELLQYSLKDAKANARRVVSDFDSLCCNVQNVVTDMTFNLGSLSGFPTLVGYFEKKNYAAAAADMRETLWCRQVGTRCTEDADMVARGCGGEHSLSLRGQAAPEVFP